MAHELNTTVVDDKDDISDTDLLFGAAGSSDPSPQPYTFNAIASWVFGSYSGPEITAAGRAIVAAADTAAQRTTLGLVIGTNVQAYDAELAAIAALTTASYGRSLLTLGSASALASEVDSYFLTPAEGNAAYQPLDAELAAIADLTSAANKVPYFTGSGTAALATLTAQGRALIDDTDATAQRATLGLANSTTVGGVPRYIGTAGEQGQAPSVYIDGTTGYLGLGTVTPLSRCEVYGNTNAASAQIKLRSEGVAGSGGGILLHYNNTGGAYPLAGDRLGYVLFGTTQAGTNKQGGGIVARAEADYSDTSWPTYFAFETCPVGATVPRVERLRITAGGNVGIGTPSPSCALDVAGPIRCGSYTVATVPSASAVGAGAMIYVSNESGGAVIAFSDGTNWRRVTDRAVIS